MFWPSGQTHRNCLPRQMSQPVDANCSSYALVINALDSFPQMPFQTHTFSANLSYHWAFLVKLSCHNRVSSDLSYNSTFLVYHVTVHYQLAYYIPAHSQLVYDVLLLSRQVYHISAHSQSVCQIPFHSQQFYHAKTHSQLISHVTEHIQLISHDTVYSQLV